MKRGERAEAMKLLAERGNEYAAAEMADYYTTQMRELTSYETAIRASGMSAMEKREALDRVRKLKIALATTVRNVSDRTIPQ